MFIHVSDGITFFKSENDVILSAGNANGVIPPKHFKHVYNIRTSKYYMCVNARLLCYWYAIRWHRHNIDVSLCQVNYVSPIV